MAQSSGPTGADEQPDEAEAPISRSAATDALWSDVRVEPLELALPAGVGYTLRAYRLSSELAAAEHDHDTPAHEDDFDVAAAEVFARRRASQDEDADDEASDRRDLDDPDNLGDLDDEQTAEAEEAELIEDEVEDETESEEAEPEEVPIFLSQGGKLLLFRSAEQLVEFVRSDAPHDLVQLDTWPELTKRISVADIAPRAEDSYELDLVVENLRGGADVWDADLLLACGEIARDLAYALRMPSVLGALAPGSPLDDLDETLRAAAAGGLGAFRARRRLRKIAGQQAALGWRTVVGKISAAVDWRD